MLLSYKCLEAYTHMGNVPEINEVVDGLLMVARRCFTTEPGSDMTPVIEINYVDYLSVEML